MSYRHEPRRNSTTVIVAADRAQARFFSAEWPELNPATLIDEMTQRKGQLLANEVGTDVPGRDRASFGPAHAFESPTDHRHATAQTFADEIVTRLEKGRNENEFGHLVVIAPALLLGEIRSRLGGPLQKLLDADLDKEVVHLSDDIILDHARTAVEHVSA